MINAKEYIKQAYKDTQGYISRMYIENQKFGTYTYHYTSDNLAKLPAIDEENLYISQNTFFRPERNKDSLKRLNMLYVDLDCYKMGIRKEYAYELLCSEYIGIKIPRPTYIIDSGRGLYLLWQINEDRNAFPRWKRVQHYLHNTLKDLGSDGSVTEDVSRVLRIPGSINTKSGTRVEILNECNYTYTLYEITKEYLPEPVINNIKDKPLKKQKTKRYGNLIRITSLNTLFYARIKDIEKLLLNRDQTGNVNLRENCLFIYRFCCCHYYNDTAKALQLTIDLFNKLSNQKGYSEKTIARRTKSAEKYYLERNRKFTNKKIIELLGISEEEQDKLVTLISKEQARKRRAERDKRAYRRKLEAQGRSTKEKDIVLRRNKIKGLLGENKGIKTICIMLGISRATYYRDLEVIKNADSLIEVPENQMDTETHKNEYKGSKTVLESQKVIKKHLDIIKSQKFHLCITRDVVLCRCPVLDYLCSEVAGLLFMPRGKP